jgi:hypothetical protein
MAGIIYNDRFRIVVDDIRKSINQILDDANITPAQVAYWVRLTANKLLGQHIQKRSSGAFLSTFDNIPILVSASSLPSDIVKQRKFFQLPGEVFDFDSDRGIEYISYTSNGGPLAPARFTQVTFTRTTPKQSHWLYKSPYTTPKPDNPYWYRVGHNIYLLGIEKIAVASLELAAYMPIDPLEMLDVNYDAPFEFPAELMDTLKRQTIDMARFSFLFPRESESNSGQQELEPTIPIAKTASVNAANQPTE